MDNLGRVIKQVAAGTASTSNPFSDERPLGADDGQILLTSNLNWLGEESTYRTLASLPGYLDVSRASPTGTSTPTTPTDFDWMGYFDLSPGPAVLSLGTHAIHRLASDQSAWPSLVLRARVESPAVGQKLGAILVAMPGVNGAPASVTDTALFAVTTVTGTGGWVDLDLSLALSASNVAVVAQRPLLGAPASGVPGDSEMVVINACTVWASFFSTSGKCQVVAVTLALEPT